MKPVRKQKLESLIQREIAGLILSGAVKDPRVGAHLSIGQVSLNNDGSLARVYVSSWADRTELHKGVEALNHAQGFLVHQMARKLDLRLLPKLVFFADESIREAMALNQKIDALVHPEEGTSGPDLH